jgi:hypothetical protein
MGDEETPAAAPAPADESPVEEPAETEKPAEEAPPEVTAKSCGIAFFVIVVIFILITVLTRSIADFDEDEGVGTDDDSVPDLGDGKFFNRIATFPICQQLDSTCNTDIATNAEIIYATEDGMKLVYTDSEIGAIGVIDIKDPANPMGLGYVDVGGEPTSTIIYDNYAVVGVNTSPNFTDPSGVMLVIDLSTFETVHSIDLGGQPDSIALSPDKTFIAIAIENERDEDLNDGAIPQLPPGYLVVVDSSSSDPTEWTSSKVDLTGLGGVEFPSDPEPEYVDINADNVCVITLQENNAIVLVDLPTLEVTASFTAGKVDLKSIDIADDSIITVTEDLDAVPREPDGVAWIGTEFFVTADEGDYKGGSRGFTIFDTAGEVVYTSGSEMDYWSMRLGHYPDNRSNNKGNEPENVRYAAYGDLALLMVNSERANLVFVYEVSDVRSPVLLQILPAGKAPEGSFAIPSRNLFVVACEKDARDDKTRSNVVIYERQEGDAPVYPSIMSMDREGGFPLPFSALSALASSGDMLYTVEDSFFSKSRIFAINATTTPYTIIEDWRIMDSGDVLASALSANEAAVLLNDDKTVNLDLEGIDVIEGGFWVCSEGRGNFSDTVSPNLIIRVDDEAKIEAVVRLPSEVEAIQQRFGFEGVAVEGDNVVVTFQRAWQGEDNPRIGIYNTADKTWKFVFYPLDTPISQNEGWVGLSDIEALGDGKFLILERDNQGGLDAGLKRLYRIDLGDFSMESGSSLGGKWFVRDLIPDLKAGNGLVMEKVEGLAVDDSGNVWINNDNDGVGDSSGENLLLNLGDIL